MFKILWYDIRQQILVYDTGHYGNNFIQTIIEDSGRYGVKVTRLFGHFLDYGFYSLQLQVETLQRLCQRIQQG